MHQHICICIVLVAGKHVSVLHIHGIGAQHEQHHSFEDISLERDWSARIGLAGDEGIVADKDFYFEAVYYRSWVYTSVDFPLC